MQLAIQNANKAGNLLSIDTYQMITVRIILLYFDAHWN